MKLPCFQLYLEAASGLCVPKVLLERNKGDHRNATGQEVADAFAETWMGHYPKPVRVRTDPEGAFQSTEFREFLASNDVFYDPIAAEAHWQNKVERKIQVIKRICSQVEYRISHSSGQANLGRCVFHQQRVGQNSKLQP